MEGTHPFWVEVWFKQQQHGYNFKFRIFVIAVLNKQFPKGQNFLASTVILSNIFKKSE